MSEGLAVRVAGEPAPQGSKNAYVRGKRAVLVEASRKVKPWRDAVKAQVESAMARQGRDAPLTGPLTARLVFYLRRPRGHYGTGRNAHKLKPSAPLWPGVKPDLDKLVRSTFDALSDAGVWEDDARVVTLLADKFYADHDEEPGVLIYVQQKAGAPRLAVVA